MGLGKTYVGAEKMVRLNNPVNLVICQKSKVNDWIEHFKKHYSEKWIYYPKLKKVQDQIFTYDLTNKNDFEDFFESDPFGELGDETSPMRVGIINFELAWRRKQLLKLKDFTLMLDESSLIQNKTAKQSKFILKLNAQNVILLSGTPTSGKYENLWTQAHLLGWDISEALYNRQYINWETIEVWQNFQKRKVKVVNKKNPYKNIERLKAKLRTHGAVFMKTEDVMSLPEQNFIEVKVPKSKEYNKFLEKGIITLDTLNLCEFKDDSDFYGKDVTPRVELVGDTTLTLHLYARQLCGQYSKDKLDAFKDLINSTNDRLIVFYNFKEELKRLTKVIGDRPYSVICGDEKNLDAYENEDNSITFIQYQAGAMGLNLQKANKVIYYSLPERSELFEQSKKRIHRINQDRPCFYYILMCEKSIEEDIYEVLKLRKDYTDELFKERLNGSRKKL